MGKRVLIALVLVAVTVGYTWLGSEEQEVPVTGRSQRVSLSDEEQQQLGLQVFDETLAQAGDDLVSEGEDYDRVRRVSQRIARVAGEDRPEFDWQFAVVRSDEVNAFCLPGGKVVVYTGLLDVARTDAQLAAVVGHEVAHAVAEHGAERIFREELTGRAISAAAGAFADDPARYQQVAALLGAGAQVGLSLPWSRSQESESDRIGLTYMARAGYDPAAALQFWQSMDRAGGSGTPEYLSTHPSGSTRMRQIQEWLPEARAELPEQG